MSYSALCSSTKADVHIFEPTTTINRRREIEKKCGDKHSGVIYHLCTVFCVATCALLGSELCSWSMSLGDLNQKISSSNRNSL
mmetsp:Transcript_35694/g.106523  ORF Transcript_35694/g.106523 Transcript_35694/m.106523 type:complete len:83 (+) Transcript_35694:2608-2856(+)